MGRISRKKGFKRGRFKAWNERVREWRMKHTRTHTHTHLTTLFPGLPRWAGTRKVIPIWILMKQETVSGSGSGISWAICKFAPCSRQITTPAPHYSIFYRLDALPAAQPTASKHWRHKWWMKHINGILNNVNCCLSGIHSYLDTSWWWTYIRCRISRPLESV